VAIKAATRIEKTCDFCNQSAFGLKRRHHEAKTFCSAHCEASFTNPDVRGAGDRARPPIRQPDRRAAPSLATADSGTLSFIGDVFLPETLASLGRSG
jgi:hypothetical protein